MSIRHAGGKPKTATALAVLLAVLCTGGSLPFAAQAMAQTRRVDNGTSDSSSPFLLRGSGDAASQDGSGDPFSNGPLSAEELSGTSDGGALAGDDNADGQDNVDGQTTSGIPAPISLSDPNQGRVIPVAPETQVLDPGNPEATPDPRANLREPPVEAGLRRVDEEEDPFLPPGFRAGTWQVFTRLEQALGYSNNNTFSAGGRPGAFMQTDGSVEFRSDWSRHQANLKADGTLKRAFGDDQGYIPSAGVEGSLRLDLIDSYAATLRGNYDYSTEALSSTSLVSGVASRPGVHAYGGSVELARTGTDLELTLRGSADRTTYEAATLSSGGTFLQNDRNNTLYQITARAAYGPTPSLKPFIEGSLGWRVFDESLDRNGQDRSSTLYDLRAGLQVDLHEKLTGEMAVGYAYEDFNDGAIPALDGITLNGTLDWSPERDTHLRLTASTAFGGSTTVNDNGSVVYTLLSEAVRRVRDNFAVSATGSYTQTRYDASGGIDHAYMAGLGAEYWISRYLSLTADVEYETLDSATPGNSWDALSVRMGIAIQR